MQLLICLQRYNKKCTYASKASLFLKNNRFYLLKQLLCYSLEACLHKSMQRDRFIRRSRIFQNRRVPLEYGLQWANVATGELMSNSLSFCENYCSARQCPKVLHLFHIRKRLSKKTTFFSAIQPNSGPTIATNKAEEFDRSSAYRPLLTPLKGEG